MRSPSETPIVLSDRAKDNDLVVSPKAAPKSRSLFYLGVGGSVAAALALWLL